MGKREKKSREGGEGELRKSELSVQARVLAKNWEKYRKKKVQERKIPDAIGERASRGAQKGHYGKKVSR